MAQEVVKTSYNVSKDILLAPHLAFTISVIVGSTGVSNNSEGRKVILAGTPVGGTTSVLSNRSTVLQVTNSSSTGANSQGVLLHDVDVTNGSTNAQLVVRGVVDLSKCPTIDSTAQTALTLITFVNGGK